MSQQQLQFLEDALDLDRDMQDGFREELKFFKLGELEILHKNLIRIKRLVFIAKRELEGKNYEQN